MYFHRAETINPKHTENLLESFVSKCVKGKVVKLTMARLKEVWKQ